MFNLRSKLLVKRIYPNQHLFRAIEKLVFFLPLAAPLFFFFNQPSGCMFSHYNYNYCYGNLCIPSPSIPTFPPSQSYTRQTHSISLFLPSFFWTSFIHARAHAHMHPMCTGGGVGGCMCTCVCECCSASGREPG